MVNDQEPRYRLVDSNGNIVGSLFQNADGNVEIQDETGTGSVFGPDGIVTPAIDAESASVEEASIADGEFIKDAGDVKHALENADGDDQYYLPTGDIDDDITVNARINVIGQSSGGGASGEGTSVSGDKKLTFESRSTIKNISMTGDEELEVGRRTLVEGVGTSGEITVTGDHTRVLNGWRPTITFESGTEGGIAAHNTEATITDNGNNTVVNNT